MKKIDRFSETKFIRLHIAEQVKLNRLTRNVTQEQLAKDMNVCRVTISNIENGRFLPSLALLYRMARYFNLTRIDQLLPPVQKHKNAKVK